MKYDVVDNIIETVGVRITTVKRIGFFIVLLPTFWDIGKLGFLRFFEWRIYPKGICIMLVGALIIYSADRVREWYE